MTITIRQNKIFKKENLQSQVFFLPAQCLLAYTTMLTLDPLQVMAGPVPLALSGSSSVWPFLRRPHAPLLPNWVRGDRVVGLWCFPGPSEIWKFHESPSTTGNTGAAIVINKWVHFATDALFFFSFTFSVTLLFSISYHERLCISEHVTIELEMPVWHLQTAWSPWSE